MTRPARHSYARRVSLTLHFQPGSSFLVGKADILDNPQLTLDTRPLLFRPLRVRTDTPQKRRTRPRHQAVPRTRSSSPLPLLLDLPYAPKVSRSMRICSCDVKVECPRERHQLYPVRGWWERRWARRRGDRDRCRSRRGWKGGAARFQSFRTIGVWTVGGSSA